MLESDQICPYAGLRPFSEEESLYFKGRDEHIEQATRQLEKNKFLIMTGASGDGKSSLIFAGVIPNARAGFLKARYSNWSVADFRPERTPYKNLSASLAAALGIASTATVEATLRHGFSALIDLYKASPLYIEESEFAISDADDEKKAIRRKASNLIILCDQFEEFFTNPENYHNGIPSQEANLVANLLLETARLSLEEGLPVYVVITMRSDFIGQCAAFRGLPEYIGFSQFFVPRLNRKQLQEVIEEPAVLSGNRISRRLSERLIEDITEGADQLPILQHALNQIWKMADEGREEMDLIHYAMVGGLDSRDLPDNDAKKFQTWFDSLPLKIRQCYDKPGLQNVLNTHANKLLNLSADFARERFGYSISDDDAQYVIRTTFKCLTKINQGRAVRNRMTLGEITRLLAMPGMNPESVNQVLTIFRSFSNALLKPYVADDEPGKEKIPHETVLDITHESLIRNWAYLKEWAAEEFDNFTIFQDFHQQLERWVAHDKSGDFLLSMGQLTYFENWLAEAKPNEYWIARYYAGDNQQREVTETPVRILENTNELIRKSRRKHLVTRTVMRYGPRRIVTALALLVLVTTSSFLLNNYLSQTEQAMRQRMKREMFDFHNNEKLYLIEKIAPYAEQLRLREVTVQETWEKIEDRDERINITTAVLSFLVTTSNGSDNAEILSGLQLVDNALAERMTDLTDDKLDFMIVETADLMSMFELAKYFGASDSVKVLARRNASRAGDLVKHVFATKPANPGSIDYLNANIEYALNNHVWSQDEIAALTADLSPFEGENGNDPWLRKNYPASANYITGWNSNTYLQFNGLYQQAAYLYAAMGDAEKALQCIDTLLAYDQGYIGQKYTNNSDNAFNIAFYFAAYQHKDALDTFVQRYCLKEKINVHEFYEQMLSRTSFSHLVTVKLGLEGFGRSGRQHNANLELSSASELAYLFDQYRRAIDAEKMSSAEKSFRIAMSNKNEAALRAKRVMDEGGQWQSDPVISELFGKAFETFRKIPEDYLDEIIAGTGGTFPFSVNEPRRALFTWPDFRLNFRPYPDAPGPSYLTPAFIEYAIDHNLIDELYPAAADVRQIEEWISAYVLSSAARVVLKRTDIPFSVLLKIEDVVDGRSTGLDFNQFYLLMGHQAMAEGDSALAIDLYDHIDVNHFARHLFNINFLYEDFYLRMIAHAMADLAMLGQLEKAKTLPKGFNNPVNRSSLYAFSAMELIRFQGARPEADVLIDSSFAEMDRVRKGDYQANKISLAGALAYRNKPGDYEEAIRVIKNVSFKELGLWMIARGLARNGELYRAYMTIPTNISDDNFAGYFFEIYYDYEKGWTDQDPFWQRYIVNRFVDNDHIQYQLDSE